MVVWTSVSVQYCCHGYLGGSIRMWILSQYLKCILNRCSGVFLLVTLLTLRFLLQNLSRHGTSPPTNWPFLDQLEAAWGGMLMENRPLRYWASHFISLSISLSLDRVVSWVTFRKRRSQQGHFLSEWPHPCWVSSLFLSLCSNCWIHWHKRSRVFRDADRNNKQNTDRCQTWWKGKKSSETNEPGSFYIRGLMTGRTQFNKNLSRQKIRPVWHPVIKSVFVTKHNTINTAVTSNSINFFLCCFCEMLCFDPLSLRTELNANANTLRADLHFCIASMVWAMPLRCSPTNPHIPKIVSTCDVNTDRNTLAAR